MTVPPTSGPPTDGRPVSVLIADDDARARQTLAELLADRGFRPVQVGSGEEAIEAVQVEVVHVVFFDLHMPRMTGLEALQQVKLINALLPAILMTADATREVIRQAFQAQVFSVIPKPVNKSVVLHTLTRALATPPKPADVSPVKETPREDRPAE